MIGFGQFPHSDHYKMCQELIESSTKSQCVNQLKALQPKSTNTTLDTFIICLNVSHALHTLVVVKKDLFTKALKTRFLGGAEQTKLDFGPKFWKSSVCCITLHPNLLTLKLLG